MGYRLRLLSVAKSQIPAAVQNCLFTAFVSGRCRKPIETYNGKYANGLFSRNMKQFCMGHIFGERQGKLSSDMLRRCK
jgi:hypothetical protein